MFFKTQKSRVRIKGFQEDIFQSSLYVELYYTRIIKILMIVVIVQYSQIQSNLMLIAIRCLTCINR